MFRPATATRRVLGLALVLSVGTGIGVGAATSWSALQAEPAAAVRPAASGTAAADPSTPPAAEATPDTTPAATAAGGPATPGVTRERVIEIATKVAPGRVVAVDKDLDETGLRYDVTLLHRHGGATQVEVDATTGRVLDTDVDDDWDRD